jgi:hypothetical protein
LASITKRNGRDTVRVRRQGTPSQCETFDRMADARRWANELDRKIDLGQLFGVDCSLGDLLDRYMHEVAPLKRGYRAEAYVVQRLRRSWLSDIWISSLSSSHLARFRDERLEEVGPLTCRRDLSVLSHAIRIAMPEWGLNLPGNPAANLRKPPQPKGRARRLEGCGRTTRELSTSPCCPMPITEHHHPIYRGPVW